MTREELIEVIRNALWRQMFARDEDAETIEYQKQVWDDDWERTLPKAKAILAAIEAAGVRLVPSEPNENMHDAFFHTRDHAWPKHRDERRAEGRGWRTLPYAIWDAMLAASPYAPQKEQTHESD